MRGRIAADGSEIEPLVEAEVTAQAGELSAQGVEIAVVFYALRRRESRMIRGNSSPAASPRGPCALSHLRICAVVLCSVLPTACSISPPAPTSENPFVGNWVTAENTGVTIRPDTIVQHQPDGESTILDKDACRGVFRFTYGTKSRQALTGLVPRQPDLRQKLSEVLVEQSYRVAELDCDRGDQTYVLLNDRQLLAIYRDGDIGAIEHLARR